MTSPLMRGRRVGPADQRYHQEAIAQKWGEPDWFTVYSKLRRRGKSMTEAARELGYHRATIWRWLEDRERANGHAEQETS